MDDEIRRLRERLASLDAERRAVELEIEQLKARYSVQLPLVLATADKSKQGQVDGGSPATEKIALFRRLFAGRPDIFAVRWENPKTGRSGYAPACANEWVKGICEKPRIKCGECAHRSFLPFTDEVIESHLRGRGRDRGGDGNFVVGVYPMLSNEACQFLAIDFDDESWSADASAVIETAAAMGIPAALERSRSGSGGHVWIFFDEPVAAAMARRLGATLLTDTMERRPDIGFSSYDRFFPVQDTMPLGGFGNLIALPLQRRARDQGNSVFVDADLAPHPDQWAFLASLGRCSVETVSQVVEAAEVAGRILGVRMPAEDEDADEPWRLPPSRRRTAPPIKDSLPQQVRVVLADQIWIDRAGLPAPAVIALIRTAAFQNPEFYRAQAMRLPTFGKPRVISCAELARNHIGLPRGCLDEAVALLRSLGAEPVIEDLRVAGTSLPEGTLFQGELQPAQQQAFLNLREHDFGVLAATTAFGKTVIAAALIAGRARNTLILVHRRELLTQWVERLKTFLGIDPKLIGTIGGGRKRPTGLVDVALIQSLVRHGEVADLVADYGHIVVDECHHLSAASFELVARRAKARYVLGLSATVARKDGHHPIIFMQCGPVRHRVDARTQAAERAMAHRVVERQTSFQLPSSLTNEARIAMPALYAALAADTVRNDMIFDDVLRALEERRSPIVLTERRDHLDDLHDRFARFVKTIAVLRGGMSSADRKAVEAALHVPDAEERLILATGRYIGEGFDDARLDTLFLTMPIAWKGTLAQYVGRLHRQHVGKTEVRVFDYVDQEVPVLARMATKRRAGFRALGYTIE
ncbi:MAG: DEAD/DEAH box helicase family protein [Bradyrhizobium sp.]|nr:DEAD/DEAH box helicase family protein [Bradyrhizobium sp.]